MSAANGPAVKSVGGFEIISKIGQGAMGTVFKARQPGLDRVVALKVLPPKIASHDPAFIDRFIREARVSAKLNHPNIVQGIEVGQDSPTKLYYFAMEYIDGPTVRQVLNWEKRIEERRALEIALGVANALVCSHRAGIVHRDIKPDNILLASNGDIKVTDLGLARSVSMGSGVRFHGEKDESQIIMGPSADAALTVVGAAIGTPSYMAPEAARAQSVDIRTDLYGVGATLFHMLTGELPFKGVDAEDTMRLLVTTPLPDPRKLNPGISVEAGQLVMRLMHKEPPRRIQTPDELVSELENLLHSREAARTSNSVIPRVRRPALKASLKGQKPPAGGATRQAIVACVIAFVIGAAGIGLLIRNGRINAEKAAAESNAPPLPPPPAAKSEGDKVVDPPRHDAPPAVVDAPAPPKVEPHPPVVDVAAKVPPAAPKSIDDRAFDAWENLVERKLFREAAVALKNFCAANKLNDTASTRLQSRMEEAVGERLKRLIAHAHDLVDANRPDEAIKELTNATFPPGEEDPFYATALEEARAAVQHKAEFKNSPAKDLENRWLADLHRASHSGAKKLADGREFTITSVDDGPHHLGKNQRETFKGISADDACILLGSSDETKLVPDFKRIPFTRLTNDSRMELSYLFTDDKAALAVLQVKWAVMRFVVLGTLSKAEVQGILEKAKADGAPDALLADARTLMAGGASKSAPPQPPGPETMTPTPAAAIDNPFIKARVSDYVDYKNGPQILRIKVIKKDDTTAVIRISDLNTQTLKLIKDHPQVTVSLQQPIDFFILFLGPDYKRVEEGDETVTVANKSYKCHWVIARFVEPNTHKDITSKAWISPDVPMLGLARWDRGAVVMDFLKSGNE